MTEDDPQFKAGAVFGRMTRTVNRAGWDSGPWDDEPDKAEWQHEGLPCAMFRNRFGSWCGYVGIPEGHVLYGKPHNDIEVDVHGGLTYSTFGPGHAGLDALTDDTNDTNGGDKLKYWWVGFDCGHAWDRQPGMEAVSRIVMPDLPHREVDEVYRTMEFAKNETNLLASQIKALGNE